jgi:hypothetical protein
LTAKSYPKALDVAPLSATFNTTVLNTTKDDDVITTRRKPHPAHKAKADSAKADSAKAKRRRAETLARKLAKRIAFIDGAVAFSAGSPERKEAMRLALLSEAVQKVVAEVSGKPVAPQNTTKKPRSADRHKEPNRDRHSEGYMREYMREYMRRWRAGRRKR